MRFLHKSVNWRVLHDVSMPKSIRDLILLHRKQGHDFDSTDALVCVTMRVELKLPRRRTRWLLFGFTKVKIL